MQRQVMLGKQRVKSETLRSRAVTLRGFGDRQVDHSLKPSRWAVQDWHYKYRARFLMPSKYLAKYPGCLVCDEQKLDRLQQHANFILGTSLRRGSCCQRHSPNTC